jgi:protein-S-isoprenylcysteine O-methyltransferase Ste14
VDNELIFRLLLLVLFVGFIAHRAYYTRKSSPSDESIVKEQEDNFVLKLMKPLSIFALLGTVIYIINPQWMAWSSLPLPISLRYFGLGFAISGFLLLQWSQTTLGKNWSDTPVLLKEHKLVQNGPYRWIRHPIYTAFLLILGSYFFISANWFIGIFWVGTSFVDIILRIQFEESIMLQQFGEHYAVYMRQTGRLLPYF